MRDKRAYKNSGKLTNAQLETMSVDTLHIGGPDCAGNQWNLTMLMNKSALGMCQGTARQDSATAAKIIGKTIDYIEAAQASSLTSGGDFADSVSTGNEN